MAVYMALNDIHGYSILVLILLSEDLCSSPYNELNQTMTTVVNMMCLD